MLPRSPRTAALALAGALLVTAGTIDPNNYLAHVKFLASPELKGRGSGTPGLEKASAYVLKQFRQDGLQPIDGKSFFQPFTVTVNAKLGSRNHLEWKAGEAAHELKFRDEFQPFNSSSSGSVAGGVVFAGYGITANEYHYDDYADVDVKGKVVVVLRHEPQENEDKSPFMGKSLTVHANLDNKAANAKIHGAVAVILVNDTPNHPGDGDTIDKFATTVGPNTPGIPFVQMKAEAANALLGAAGKSIQDLVTAIDKDLKPQSFAVATVTAKVQTDVERQNKTVHNIVGFLPGETDEYVIIGAHYDHLGMGEQSSLATGDMKGKPHLGADDNASGTAGVLELAKRLSKEPKRKRGIVFLAFASEELGLLGSNYYVNHPELPLEKCVAMINLDMIGRVREGKVFVGGSGTGSTLKTLLDETKGNYKLTLDLSEQAGYGSSDHASFTPKGVPVLFFFSGLHADYHKPTDTWDKIDAKQATELLEFVGDVADKLASSAERPQYVKLAPPKQAGGGGGYGAWFGSMPDFAEVPNGFRFADVMPGSPALKAGLKPGDVLFEFDGKPITNLYDFTAALRTKKPGDTVLVKVHRGPEIVEAKVTLEVRR
jgi:hypothetical protein